MGKDEFYAVLRENMKDNSDNGNIEFRGVKANTLDECVNIWKLFFLNKVVQHIRNIMIVSK